MTAYEKNNYDQTIKTAEEVEKLSKERYKENQNDKYFNAQ